MARRRYSQAFMDDAVQLVHEQGESIHRVADELGIPHGTLWNWVRKSQGPSGKPRARDTVPLRSPEQEEIARLRKRVTELEQENEFLGKASAYFARKRQP